MLFRLIPFYVGLFFHAISLVVVGVSLISVVSPSIEITSFLKCLACMSFLSFVVFLVTDVDDKSIL